MPRYSFIDEKTGKKYDVEFDRPPSKEDWDEAVDQIVGSKKTGLLHSLPAGVESLFATGSNIIGKMGYEATGGFHYYLANIQEALGQPTDVVQNSRNIAKEAWEIARYAGTQEELKRRKLAEKYPGNPFARQVGEAAASLAPTLATLPLGGAAGWGRTGQILLGAGTAGGTSAAMEHYEQRTLRFDRYKMTHGHLDQNDLEMMAVGEALVPALGSGLLTAGITAGSGFAGTKLGLGGGVEALGVKAGGTAAASKVPWMMRGSRATATAKQAGGQALSEGIEEGFDEILQSYIVKRMTINPDITFSDAVGRGVDAFMVGAALGGSIGGIGTKDVKEVIEARAELQRRKFALAHEEMQLTRPRESDTALEKKLNAKIRKTYVEAPTEIIRKRAAEAVSEADPATELARGWMESARREAGGSELAAEGLESMTRGGADPLSRVEPVALPRRKPRVAEEFKEPSFPVSTPRAEEVFAPERRGEPESRESDVLKGPEREASRVVPLKTSNEIFGIGRARKARIAEREVAEAEREAAFTGAEAVATAGEPVVGPDPVSRVAELGEMFPEPKGTQGVLTPIERAAFKRERGGGDGSPLIPQNRAERILRDKATKKVVDHLREIQEKRKKTKRGKQLNMLGMGTAYEVMVDIGLEAAIATAETSSSVAKVMRSALDAMKMSNPKAFADVDVEDIKAYMAGRIAERMGGEEGGYHYGDMGTASDTTQDRMTSGRSTGHLGTGTYFLGSPDTGHLAETRPERRIPLEGVNLMKVDTSGRAMAIHEGLRWFNEAARTGVKADASAASLAKELFLFAGPAKSAEAITAMEKVSKMFMDGKDDGTRTPSTYLIQELGYDGIDVRGTSLDNTMYGSVVYEKPFKASIKKLEKLQKKLRAFHRKGKLGANPIIEIAATAADVAVEVAIKTLNAGGTINAAIDKAYASLGETDIKYSEFNKYIYHRMLGTLNELAKGNSMKAAIRASAEPMEGKTYEELQRDAAKDDLAMSKGVHPDIDKDIKDFRAYSNIALRNIAGGPAEAMAGSGAFMGIGARLNAHVDYADSFAATLSTMLLEEGNSDSDYNDSDSLWDKWMGKPSEEFKAAAAEFAVYYEAQYEGKLDKIDYDGMSERGKSLIRGWKKLAKFSGKLMADEGIIVKYPDAKERKFIMLGEKFFHHSLKRQYSQILNSLDASSKMTQSIEDIGIMLKDAGEIDAVSTEAIREWWIKRTGGKPKKLKKGEEEPIDRFIGHEQVDAFFASIDRARTKGRLPSEMMDFTLEGAQGYIHNWAERFAQIKAYGQKTKNKKDLFELVLRNLDKQGYTDGVNYLKDVRKAAYGISDKQLNSGQRMLMLLNKSATVTMLTGVFNSLKNLTGIGPSAATFGYARTFKALLEMRNYAAAAKKTRSWGVIRDNMALLLSGHDITLEGMGYLDQADKGLTRATKWGLRASGFTQSENFVRTTTALTASSLVSEGVGAIKSSKNEGLQKELKELSGQMGIDWKKLVEEDSSQGAETLKFVRNAVKKVQGGYRFNQLPNYMATPIGRFMFKFGAYSQQIGNLVWHNGIKRATKGDLKPLMLLLAQAAGSGELLYGIRDAIFGKPRPDATLKELFQGDNKAYNLFMRLVNDVTYAGTLGIVADMAGMAKNVASKQRVRNPFDPAGLQIITNTLQFLLERVNEGTILKPWTWDEGLGYFIKRQFSIMRYGKSGVMNLASKLGIEFDMVESERAFQNRNFLRNATERFQLSVGDDVKSKIGAGTTLPGPYTRFYRAVKDRLTLGDVNGAREAAEAFSKELDPKSRGRAWQRLSQSIMRSQPIKVGHSTSKEIQEEFITWAKRNLSQSDVNTIMKVQHTFFDTAKDAGLIGASSEKAKRDMKKLMNLKLPRDRRRGGGAVRPMSTAEDYLRRENRRMKEAFGY